jgi:2'-hydroxyisoflavone reductase
MRTTRRQFVEAALAAIAAAACAPMRSSSGPAAPRAGKKTILILGGTGFLGPHLVDSARARGHVVTLFNRGKTHPGLFPDLEKLHGDRDGHLEALAGRKWDAVIDTSGYVPRVVKQSADLLAPNVGQYVFISTISVYSDTSKPGMDESGPLEKLPEADAQSEDVMKYYGALKALCESTVETALPGRTCTIRPGLIVGPGDPTDRFTYWPVRLDRGGEVLAPGDGHDPMQFVDARDLADFAIGAVEQKTAGIFNATGPAPETPLTTKAFLDSARAAINPAATLTWVPMPVLEKNKVEPWSDLPGWVPGEGDTAGFGTISAAKAIALGLKFRPAVETAKDTLAWWKQQPAEQRAKLKAGLSPEREAAVLADFHAGEKK